MTITIKLCAIMCGCISLGAFSMDPNSLKAKQIEWMFKIIGNSEGGMNMMREIMTSRYGDTICNVLKHTKYLEANRDAIERYIAAGAASSKEVVDFVVSVRWYTQILKDEVANFVQTLQWFVVPSCPVAMCALRRVTEIVTDDGFRHSHRDFDALTLLDLAV